VPKAVEVELNVLMLPEYILRKPVSEIGHSYVKGAMGSLHAGELEAMVLAQETQADLVLMDNLTARNKAKRLGLAVMGTVGILKLANAKQLLSASQTAKNFDLLVLKHGLYITDKILKQIKESLS
jgi:predicted nucleic acid-binding protein